MCITRRKKADMVNWFSSLQWPPVLGQKIPESTNMLSLMMAYKTPPVIEFNLGS